MAQPDWNAISNYITIGVALLTARQLLETIRPIKGKGLIILLGDFGLLATIPWIISVFVQQKVTLPDALLPVAIGILLALPLIFATKFISKEDHKIRYKKSVFLYLFIIGIPFFRKYAGFSWFFQQHPIFIPHTHIPNIQLMIVMYVTVIVVNTYVWRIVSYLKFLRKKRELLSGSKSLASQQ